MLPGSKFYFISDVTGNPVCHFSNKNSTLQPKIQRVFFRNAAILFYQSESPSQYFQRKPILINQHQEHLLFRYNFKIRKTPPV